MAKRIENKNSEIIISVTLDKKVWETAQKKAFTELSNKLEIKGFRKGKVPLNIAKKNISSAKIWQHAINANIETLAKEARKEITDKDKVIAGPFYKVSNVSNTQLEIHFSYVVYPDIKINNYKNLDVEYKEEKATTNEIKDELKRIQDKLTIWTVVNSPIEKGQKVKFDFEGFINNKPFSNGKAENYELIIGSNKFIPGFEDQMIGLKSQQEKELHVTFPKEYHDKNMAGEKAMFKVKIHEVYKKIVPALDDALAIESNIPNVKTFVELKAFIKDLITNSKKQLARQNFKNKAFAIIKDKLNFKVPEVLVNQEIQRLVQELERTLKQSNMTINDYQKSLNLTPEQLLQRFKTQANERLTDSFIFAEISKKEGLKISKEEYDKHYQKIADTYKQDIETIKKSIPIQQLQIQIMNDKVLDVLIQNRKKK